MAKLSILGSKIQGQQTLIRVHFGTESYTCKPCFQMAAYHVTDTELYKASVSNIIKQIVRNILLF